MLDLFSETDQREVYNCSFFYRILLIPIPTLPVLNWGRQTDSQHAPSATVN